MVVVSNTMVIRSRLVVDACTYGPGISLTAVFVISFP